VENQLSAGHRDPAIIDAEIDLCGQTLVEPLIAFQLSLPLSIMVQGGTTFTFPPGITLYISPADIAYELGRGFQKVIAETQREEEERWLRMSADELQKRRQEYIPF
jgi:hypothetical protein